jgi:hypothetical protein
VTVHRLAAVAAPLLGAVALQSAIPLPAIARIWLEPNM